MMIQLRSSDSRPVLVNLDSVNYVQPSGEKTAIVFNGGNMLIVADSFEAVAELFDPERQAAELRAD